KAREALWQAGLDYDHGTGHGVGCYLSVHEAAASMAKGARGNVAFEPGMLLSNEPGFYKPDRKDAAGAVIEQGYGIRIENLVFVREDGKRRETDKDVAMLSFETITLAPIDKRLIKPEMLSDAELQWFNDYHEKVYQTLSPRMDADTAA